MEKYVHCFQDGARKHWPRNSNIKQNSASFRGIINQTCLKIVSEVTKIFSMPTNQFIIEQIERVRKHMAS